MKIGPFDISLSRKDAATVSLNTLLARLEAQYETFSGTAVTPDNCMQSPTVQAIVTAISRRIAILPIKVMKTTVSKNRTRKEELPSHPVARLLKAPNSWQDRTAFWLDATSQLIRYGNVFLFKSQGSTGPIRELIPLNPGAVAVTQDDEWRVHYRLSLPGGGQREYEAKQIMHARGAARDGIRGDSPIMDIREAIALEITAERMGASVFGNGASPGMVFKHGATSRGFKSAEEEKSFVTDFQKAYSGKGRFKSMILPAGMEMDTVPVDNDKAQFLATRQYQRTVIAGAFGVPPHLVGDLSRGTFNNVEQQSLDFIVSVVLPYVRTFEAAMERALLTDEDRREGVIIRFNLDGALRGDFKSRQEGLKIQREMGVISPNDWREVENMNPISDDDGGETYWVKGPSGQGDEPAADEPKEPEAGREPDADQEGTDNDRNA
jgi:HK97 family phage portal protein